ncbi:MAG: imidazole glycerol phosphate synthase subunit HisH [Euryhalocaulis sp.]|uniref:imidazole glycerol phosphate synthase subunit HisH n=1 Tax=Euryhalocaulis sp. TaxID=2744307 RepID=UPI001839E67C|nr:imidazole glycerol phosphate synthase subunit HisH [Euryhalocaulis sp.]MBA4801987.1 imidazole glycerol phosphate synthase subunit HisH [Euryhalocaulis sp.]
MSVAVVDLGCGNIASMMFALERLGARAALTRAASDIAAADRVILPGVGTAGFAMRQIDALGLRDALMSARPLLGVCLGHQLLFERSEEGGVDGLGLIEGDVTRLQGAPDRPIPHMGWNTLDIDQPDCPLLKGVEDGAFVYFVHTFASHAGPSTAASTRYGEAFSSVAASDGVYGCQFHPERSAAPGAQILKNFLEL